MQGIEDVYFLFWTSGPIRGGGGEQCHPNLKGKVEQGVHGPACGWCMTRAACKCCCMVAVLNEALLDDRTILFGPPTGEELSDGTVNVYRSQRKGSESRAGRIFSCRGALSFFHSP